MLPVGEVPTRRAVTARDVEYLRHGDGPLLASVFVPEGDGPFPAIVELHGGAWCKHDRSRGRGFHEAMAARGIVVVAPDFRQGEAGAYPRSVSDVNYAVRWAKAHARDLRTREDLVGLAGRSSGGHLAMLLAMRPRDPRYGAIPLPPGLPDVDASVPCVVMFWPVINPAGRYRFSLSRSRLPEPPDWCAGNIRCHRLYWSGEAQMSEASPLEMLARGEPVETPPAIWIQPVEDPLHVYRDPASPEPATDVDRFAAAYRTAGGEIAVKWFDAPTAFVDTDPAGAATQRAYDLCAAFIHRHIPVPPSRQ